MTDLYSQIPAELLSFSSTAYSSISVDANPGGSRPHRHGELKLALFPFATNTRTRAARTRGAARTSSEPCHVPILLHVPSRPLHVPVARVEPFLYSDGISNMKRG